MKYKEMLVKQIITILLLLMSFALMHAALAWDDSSQIRQGVNIEWFRTGIETTDGCAIYVWSDTKLGERDLWAQKVDANGNLVWGDPVLIDGKADRQEDPTITRTSDGHYIIAWIDFSIDQDGDVFAQKINEDGQLLWAEGGKPVCVYPGEQIALNMEADNAGGAFIVWQDRRNPSYDLYAQRISSTGDPLWALNGIPIANTAGDETQNTMLHDGNGGMMIAYTWKGDTGNDVYAKHFNSSGIMTWDEAVELAVTDGDQDGVRMAKLSGGDFVFTWHDQRSGDFDIYAQKLNLSGTKLWPEPYVVFSDATAPNRQPQKNPRIQATTDDSVVIVWEDKRLSNQTADLFAQKINAAGVKQWDADGLALCTENYEQLGVRMATAPNGGVFIVWDDYRNDNTPNEDIYAQYLSATGEALWGEGGKAICNAPFTQNGGLIKYSDNKVFINWMDQRDGSVGIYYQVVNIAGEIQLEEDGVEVFWGLSGDALKDSYFILPHLDGTAILWLDTRYSNIGERAYFQFLDADGNTTLTRNGVPITETFTHRQQDLHAIALPDGHIAVVWRNSSDMPQVYAQLISPTGERLWGDSGLKITSEDNWMSFDQAKPKISYFDGKFYLGWRESEYTDTGFRWHVWGQCLNGTEKLWGPDGIRISVNDPTQINEENLLEAIIDNIYIWDHGYGMPIIDSHAIVAKKVKANGSAATGWNPWGNKAASHDGIIKQYSPKVMQIPLGTLVVWEDSRGDNSQYYYQIYASNGAVLLDPEGEILAEGEYEQQSLSMDLTHTGVVFAWSEMDGAEYTIKAKKLPAFNGISNWGDSGIVLVRDENAQDSPSVSAFAGGGLSLAWVDYYSDESDLYYNYLNADGSLVFPTGGEVLCDAIKKQYQPESVTLNNEVVIVWADGRSSGKTEILGLHAQKITNETVSVNDQSASPELKPLTLGQNYPNPFNPHTTISLSLPMAQDVSLSIYNSKGQLVRRLHKGALEKGKHSFSWDGKDDKGAGVASGVYMYKAEAKNYSESRKMLLMK